MSSGEFGGMAAQLRETLSAVRPERPTEPEIRALIAAAGVRRARQRVAWWSGVGAGIAAAAAVIVFALGTIGSPLKFTIGPAQDPGVENRWIGTEAAQPVPLNFSDGTAVDLMPGSRARVAALGRRGASLNLETGRLHARVVHRRLADWGVSAGPYTVHVIGTEFDVTWNPEKEELEVGVKQGTVKVSGPALSDDQTVSAKQVLTVALRDRHALIAPWEQDKLPSELVAAVQPPPAPAPAPVAVADLQPAPAPVRERSVPADNGQWVAFAKRGEYQKALEIVQRAGFDNVAQTSGPDELLRLSDLARVAGQPGRAAEILHTTRKRYPRTEAASIAAYTLGVTDFDQSASYGDAARWFEIYLRERPSGPLAAEALGRLMETEERLGRREKAEAAARKYLNAYPNGSHRDVATRLAGR